MEAQDVNRLTVTYRVSQLLAWSFIVPVFFFPAIVTGNAKAELTPLPEGAAAIFTIIALLSIFLAKRLSAVPLIAAKKHWVTSQSYTVLQSSWLLGLIVGSALRELCGIIGLVLSLMSGNLSFSVWLGLIAFFSMARNWPTWARLSEFAAAVRKHGPAGG